MDNRIRVYGIKEESMVDGPGIRFALFTQGCTINCPDCHNPEARDPRGGVEMDVEEILEQIKKLPHLDGVTFSGGEPFLQAGPLSVLGKRVKEKGLHLIVFTGYTWEELMEMWVSRPEVGELLKTSDILVDGPYVSESRDLTRPFRGSSNQRMIKVADSLEKGEVVTS